MRGSNVSTSDAALALIDNARAAATDTLVMILSFMPPSA